MMIIGDYDKDTRMTNTKSWIYIEEPSTSPNLVVFEEYNFLSIDIYFSKEEILKQGTKYQMPRGERDLFLKILKIKKRKRILLKIS